MDFFGNLTKNINPLLDVITTSEDSISYKVLLDRSTSSSELLDIITKSKSVLCLRMSHSALYIQTILSFIYADRPFVPVNPSATKTELEHILHETQASYLFTDQRLEDYSDQLIFQNDSLYVYDLRPVFSRVAQLQSK